MAWVVAAKISDDGGQNSLERRWALMQTAADMKMGMQPLLTNSVGKLEFFAGV